MKKKILLAAVITAALCTACGIPNAKSTAGGTGETVDFSGEWSDEADGTTVIDLWCDDDGLWHGEISRSSQDDTADFWSFSGAASGSEITYDDMRMIRGEYDREGEVTETLVYENGSGAVGLKDGKLYWRDDKENTADGLTFINTGEY